MLCSNLNTLYNVDFTIFIITWLTVHSRILNVQTFKEIYKKCFYWSQFVIFTTFILVVIYRSSVLLIKLIRQ